MSEKPAGQTSRTPLWPSGRGARRGCEAIRPTESRLCSCMRWGGCRFANQSQHRKAAARGSLSLLQQLLRLQRLRNCKTLSGRLLAKMMSCAGLWASPLPKVRCMGEININFKAGGDESSFVPNLLPSQLKQCTEKTFLFIQVRK